MNAINRTCCFHLVQYTQITTTARRVIYQENRVKKPRIQIGNDRPHKGILNFHSFSTQ
ncbi:hypothetical protein MA16_Dca001638 [Dendrobium catenatum]|uniref:Uncharacterized protein n=1 Tax=Dendrobium catenatum TaxID=906689 RepID=A0A2I0WMY5_9ASPA|nr:hypothetical protein MA16_Dca001638 [Dendrobium catenatum]